ncbi:MAG: type II toxin-antitoxin system HicA family toxin [Bacteroidales bacterium]|jgi:mRNA interferase HicA|nr:type II toxin-antitoxin system HicA family toxin [Bacteroidales bacterium]
MKRSILLKYLTENGCVEFREGANHTIMMNNMNKRKTALPRHSEIGDILANEICKQLGIKKIK